MWIYKQHRNVYLKAMLELIKWAPRRAQISLVLCCSQVGLWEFNPGYLIPHNKPTDLTGAFFFFFLMSFLQWIVMQLF